MSGLLRNDGKLDIDLGPMASCKVYFTEKNLKTLPEWRLNDMVTRILTPVVKYGLMENPVCNPGNDGCLKQAAAVTKMTARIFRNKPRIAL